MIALLAGEDAAPAYLEGLNTCFPGWGGQEMFDWCFRRTVGGPAADLLGVEERGRLVAGSAIVYRRAIRRNTAPPQLIAIMSGSWTLPEARGQGLFKAMIQASRGRAAERGCAILIAFAHDANPSARALAGQGAVVAPAAYLAHPGSLVRNVVEPAQAQAIESLFAGRAFPAGISRISYQGDEWSSQLLHRPRPVETVRLSTGEVAICERGAGAVRILDVSRTDPQSFAAAAAEMTGLGAPLVAYTTEEEALPSLAAAGFTSRAGGVYILETGEGSASPERWWFANGDRM